MRSSVSSSSSSPWSFSLIPCDTASSLSKSKLQLLMITGLVRSAKRNTGISRRADQLAVGRHRLDTLNGLRERHRNYIAGLQRHHHSALSARERAHCRRAEISRQHAIECIWPATALQVAQHHATCLAARDFLEILLQVLADATQTRCTKSITLVLINQLVSNLQSALSNDDDAEVRATHVARTNLVGDDVERKGNLRNEDHVSSAGDTRVKCNPT